MSNASCELKPSDVKVLKNIDLVGLEWLIEQIRGLKSTVVELTPVEFSEKYRYLPESVTSRPGPMNFRLFPYMREILNCFDAGSPIREVNFMKGVQIGYTTLLESGIFYFMFHIKTVPIMFLTAEKEMAKQRVQANFIPMIQASKMQASMVSDDIGNNRKAAVTDGRMSWEGGGYMILLGAKNPNAARMHSVMILCKDEIDGWDHSTRDGDLDSVSDDRCSSYHDRRKIFRGSTPSQSMTSKILPAFLKGDQRYYQAVCKGCKKTQSLRFKGGGKDGKKQYGLVWKMDGLSVDVESVRYVCKYCDYEHREFEKPFMFAEANGAHWRATAESTDDEIRSYHLSALYSPFQPWSKCIKAFLEGYDVDNQRVKNVGKLQKFYNNILGEAFEVQGGKVKIEQAEGHVRTEYDYGQVPNKFALKHCEGKIVMITMTIDVHKERLAIAITGWARGMRSFLIDYLNIPGNDFAELSEPGWARVDELIMEHSYTSSDGRHYRISNTFIDSGYNNEKVCEFCARYDANVYPILGRARTPKNRKIQEFSKFTTQAGTQGYMILVDHYKDRLHPILRGNWEVNPIYDIIQPVHSVNFPIGIKKKHLKELINETRVRKKDEETGAVSYIWSRSGDNELWDLMVYGHALVEILAWELCVERMERKTIDWPEFWDYLENDKVYYSDVKVE